MDEDRFVGKGVEETQSICVQTEAGHIVRDAIDRIAQQRVAHRSHVHADLMSSSALQAQPDERTVLSLLQPDIGSVCRLAMRRTCHAVERSFFFGDRSIDHAAFRADAMDQRDVFFVQLSLFALLAQPGRGDRISGKQLDA